MPVTLQHVIGLRCLICGKRHHPDALTYVCPRHGREGVLDVEYDYDRVQQMVLGPVAQGMWRYLPMLPLCPTVPRPVLQVGGTPMYRAAALEQRLGLASVWVKDEGRQPTGSLKDRASALAVALARSCGAGAIATASTGNAAAALAGMSVGSGLGAVIFVPARILPAKVAQLHVYGAQVVLVDGSYHQAYERCQEACEQYGWYNRNTGFNPYMTEGKKTVVFEMVEQWCREQEEVDAVFVGVGDGCILGAIHKGFKDLLALGWIRQMPRLFGVQAAGSDYLYRVWCERGDVLNAPAITTAGVADSLMAGLPRDRLKAMAAVQQSEGAFIRVSDEEVLAAIPDLARGSGVFTEPAGAAAYAGLLRALDAGLVAPGERVVLIATGSGLKDVGSAMQSVAPDGISVVPQVGVALERSGL